MYKIVIDGRVIIDGASAGDPNRGRATASNYGSFEIKFSTTPGSRDLALPSVLNPVTTIKLVEVRDSQNRVVLANSFGTPQPGGGGPIEKDVKLTSTGTATGSARADIGLEREKLRVDGDHLQSGVALEIFVDGLRLGTVVPQLGYFQVDFTSDNKSGRLLPQALRPVTKIQRVEVRGSSGQIVLQGTFQAGGDDFGGGGGGGAEVRREASLNPTGIDADAKGRVRTRASTSREMLEINGDRLNSNAQYSVIVNGFSLGPITSDVRGSFSLSLSTENGTLPPQVRPVSNIQRVDVMDSQGRRVLTGGPPT